MYLSNHGRICFTCSSGYSSLVHIVGVLKSSWQLLFNYSTVTFILLSSSMSITFDMKTKLSSSSLDHFAIVFLIPSLNCSETFPLMLSLNEKNITMTDFRFPQLPLCIPLKATDKGKKGIFFISGYHSIKKFYRNDLHHDVKRPLQSIWLRFVF